MAITYDVPKGQVFSLHGPATVSVKSTVEEPVIGDINEVKGEAPGLSALNPNTAVSGDADFTLSCQGSGFTDETTIMFGDHDERTTLVSDTEVTTIVKPSLFAPADVQVAVRNGPLYSSALTFSFTDPGASKSKR